MMIASKARRIHQDEQMHDEIIQRRSGNLNIESLIFILKLNLFITFLSRPTLLYLRVLNCKHVKYWKYISNVLKQQGKFSCSLKLLWLKIRYLDTIY